MFEARRRSLNIPAAAAGDHEGAADSPGTRATEQELDTLISLPTGLWGDVAESPVDPASVTPPPPQPQPPRHAVKGHSRAPSSGSRAGGSDSGVAVGSWAPQARVGRDPTTSRHHRRHRRRRAASSSSSASTTGDDDAEEPPVTVESIDFVSRVLHRALQEARQRLIRADERAELQSRLLAMARSAEFLALHEALGSQLCGDLAAAHAAAARRAAYLAVGSNSRADSTDAAARRALEEALESERRKRREAEGAAEGLRAEQIRLRRAVSRGDADKAAAVRSMEEELSERDEAIARLQAGQLRLLRRLGGEQAAATGVAAVAVPAAASRQRDPDPPTAQHSDQHTRSWVAESAAAAHHRDAADARGYSYADAGGGAASPLSDLDPASPVVARGASSRRPSVSMATAAGPAGRSESTATAKMTRAVASLPANLLALLNSELAANH